MSTAATARRRDEDDEQLGRIYDQRIFSRLVRYLYPVRWNIAKALGLMRAEEAALSLAVLLDDDDPNAASVAAEALALIGTPQAYEMLLLPLRDREWTSRRKAATQALETVRSQ